MPMIDWQANCKDAMWGMFWVQQNHHPGAGADKEALKENVARLIRMTTQKTAGQRGSKKDVHWDAITPTIMSIVCCATALCLSGEFGDMPDTIDEPD